jgi:aspartyl/asparaginyl-tRNA synthetase
MNGPWFRGRALSGLILVGLAAAVAACSTIFATRIGDILKSPGAYEGKEVTVEGKVTATHNLLVVKYYQVDDGTGEIAVVTESALPKEDEKVRVKGRVNQAFAIGSSRLIVIVEKPPSR